MFSSPFFQIIRLLVIASISFGLVMVLEPVLSKFLFRFKFGKQIRSEGAPIFSALHAKKAGTPTMGGIMIWVAVLTVTLLFHVLAYFFDSIWSWLDFFSRAQTLLPLATFIFAALVGLVDDFLGVLRIGPRGGGLRVREKIILYVLIALLGASWFYFKLGFDVIHVPFWGNVAIGLWYIPFFVLVITATAFSVNEADGLDGLAGGVVLPAFGALAVVAFVQGRYDLAAFTVSIIGALLAFLWFNVYPAKFFMGDTGAMALGVSLGMLSMFTNTALFLPFFGFVLVLESLSVIVQKSWRQLFSEKLFLSTPIHHHLEAIGWPEARVTMRFWVLAGVGAAIGMTFFFLDRLISG